MFRNYIKVAVRNLLRHKAYSAINIAGLAIGMAACIVISLWVSFHLSFDNFQAKGERIYVIINKIAITGKSPFYVQSVSGPVGPALKTDYPEIIDYTRFLPLRVSTPLQCEGRKFNLESVCFTDQSFFDVFSFGLISGDPGSALSEPNNMVLTEKTAERIFGNEDPLGKAVYLPEWGDYRITGVLRNVPANSVLQFNALIPIHKSRLEWSDWPNNNALATYLLLDQEADPKALEKKFPEFLKKFLPNDDNYVYYLQPLRDIHLHSTNIGTQGCKTVDITYIYIFPLVAFFILLIACINYMNLSTARSAGRAREVGLRKTVGASRFQLIRQFLSESVFQSMLALILAVSLVELALPAFNTSFGTRLSLVYPGNWLVLAGFVAVALGVGLLAGSYPAFFLSSFKPLAMLKGLLHRGSTGLALRRSLVVLQFGISIVLIVSTLLIARQLRYLQEKDMGFNREQVINVPIPGGVRTKFDALRQELLSNPAVTGITASSEKLGVSPWQQSVEFEGKNPNEKWMFNIKVVDPDYIPFYGLKIVDGRGFSRDFGTDSILNAYVINEALARKIGWDSPVGKRFKVWSATHDGTVIGVVKDFNYLSLKQKLEPIALTLLPQSRLSSVSIRIRPENTAATLKYIEDIWNRFEPDLPFEYSFLDEEFAQLYEAERMLGRLSGIFSLLAVFIACLGLLGLISYAAESRTKEIGIRKVLGASVKDIVLLLSKEFIWLLCLATLIAWPVAWYFVNRWLQNFAYRIDLDWMTFLLGGVIALAIAALTVSYQAVKAATANPADALRYE